MGRKSNTRPIACRVVVVHFADNSAAESDSERAWPLSQCAVFVSRLDYKWFECCEYSDSREKLHNCLFVCFASAVSFCTASREQDDAIKILIENRKLLRTAGGFDVVHRVAVQLEHFRRLRLLLLVAAHGEGVLRDLNEDVVTFLPLLPDAFAPGVQVPGKKAGDLKKRQRPPTYLSIYRIRLGSKKPTRNIIADRIDLRRVATHDVDYIGLHFVRDTQHTPNPIRIEGNWTHPQCFILSGLSMRQAILIRKSLSVAFLGTSILCHSGNLGGANNKNKEINNKMEARKENRDDKYLGSQRSRSEDNSSQFLVLESKHTFGFGEEFHLDLRQRVSGGEVALSVPPDRKCFFFFFFLFFLSCC